MTGGGASQRGGKERQCAALPVVQTANGPRIVLVTSRDTRRWVLPKGWVNDGLSSHRAAEREALEEAGLEGEIERSPFGAYSYGKRLADGSVRVCTVAVHLLRVTRLRESWPEMRERERRQFTAEEAAGLVQEPELAALLRAFGAAQDSAEAAPAK